MILSLGSENYTVPGKNLKVSGSFAMVRKDLGGFTSGTDFSSGGVKPKRLNVALDLPYAQEDDMKQLTAIATAVDSDGDPINYDIVDRTARAMLIRQVHFQDNFRVAEHDTLEAWSVSFTLEEWRSIPELVEQRQEPKEGQAATVNGEAIAPSGGVTIASIIGAAKRA
jgi:hypothetical protein